MHLNMPPSTSIPALYVEGVEVVSSSPDLSLKRSDHSESSSANSKHSSSGPCERLDTPDESTFQSKSSSSSGRFKRDLWESPLRHTEGIHAASPESVSANHHANHSIPGNPETNTVSSLESQSRKSPAQFIGTRDAQNQTTLDSPAALQDFSQVAESLENIAAPHPSSSTNPRLIAETKQTASQSTCRPPKYSETRLGQYHPQRYQFAHPPRGVAVDVNPSGFLLERAAKAAERQIREQALHAFPNDDRHQQIAHYVNLSITPASSSRGSQHDSSRSNSVDLELSRHSTLHQRRHLKREVDLERLEMRRKLQKRAELEPLSFDALPEEIQNVLDPEMAAMQKGASPPLLGQDIEFPRSESPPPARFDITQGSEFLKRTVCYLTEQTETSPPESAGLWTPQKSEPAESPQSSVPVSRTTSHCGGLWGAIDASLFAPSGPTGLTTPRIDDDGHDSGFHSSVLRHLPPSPPPSTSGLAALEERLEAEASIAQEAEAELATCLEEDFDDGFVTQVYNYLSLGYPAVARNYDEELSKISGVPVDELKQDDRLPSSRGYIRLGDAEVFDGVTEDMCIRWKALKLYVHEWARQQPGMIRAPEFGIPERKGTWGT